MPLGYKTARATEIEEENIENNEKEPEATTGEYSVENDSVEMEAPLTETDAAIERDEDNEDTLDIEDPEEGSLEPSEDKTGDKTDKNKRLSLQVPQGVEIVIDPWEMDGKTQIYSKQYTVKNCGKTTGRLVLSELACTAESEGIKIQTDKKGLHTGDDKSMYMEMIFGNGEKITLSPEDSQYETELEPGEKLSFCFSGEVNENASADWSGSDIAVTVVYSWDAGPEEETDLTEKSDSIEPSEEEDVTDMAETEKKTEENRTDAESQEADAIKEKKEDREEETRETGETEEEKETKETDETGMGAEESAEEKEKN